MVSDRHAKGQLLLPTGQQCHASNLVALVLCEWRHIHRNQKVAAPAYRSSSSARYPAVLLKSLERLHSRIMGHVIGQFLFASQDYGDDTIFVGYLCHCDRVEYGTLL